MTLSFSIEYITRWGEELRLQCGGAEHLMTTDDGRLWTVTLHEQPTMPYRMTYRYAMYRDGRLVWTEWEVMPHTLDVNPSVASYKVTDSWRPIPDDLPLFTTAYTDWLMLEDEQPLDVADTSQTLQLRTVFPRLMQGERLAVMSSLDGWQRPTAMTHLGLHEWVAVMPSRPFEYKFVVVNTEGNIILWEEGDNRSEDGGCGTDQHLVTVKSCGRPRITRPDWRVAGVVIPVFSLRTEESQGVGDFGDLLSMVRWAASVGMRAVQVLPINDTTQNGTFTDSYPYNAISIFALHPMYCDLRQLGGFDDDEDGVELRTEAHLLNTLSQVDYVAVNRLKREYLYKHYAKHGRQVMDTEGYKTFFEDSRHWLVPYSVFSHLRDTYGTAWTGAWPKLAKYDADKVEAMWNGKEKKLIHYYAYVQYILHTQLIAVRDEAARLGVILKGDIPIGISRCSVEAWMEPWLFRMDTAAGAPPDAFAADGQNWGFPTYNWDVMAEHGYEWWKRRFTHMSRYFNAYRIDHVLGFFRIWQIPTHAVSGILGQFSPALPMTLDEIHGYGLDLDYDRLTRPYITDYVLTRIFGERAQLVRSKFVNRLDDRHYAMKDGYNTQVKVRDAVKDDERLRDVLYALIANVLFLKDHSNPSLLHPRIAAHDTLVYQSLFDDQRAAFDRLYEHYFYKRHNDFWRTESMKKLPALTQCTRMLVCAEDLGMVPECVQGVMDQLRILSLEIQTMPKQYGLEFSILDNNPVRSVATISTHDMPTMRGWWREDYDRASRFWCNVLHHGGAAPRELPSWLAEDIVWRHLSSPSMLCLISLQDWLATDENLMYPDPDFERINVPANPRQYWRYRMHLTIEQLAGFTNFNAHLRQTIKASGRLTE